VLYRLSEREDLTGRLSFSRFDPADPAIAQNDTALEGGYAVRFSETLQGNFGLGIVHLSGSGLDDNRITGSANVTQRYASGSLGVALSREVNPTGSGSLAQVDRAAVESTQKLGESVSLYLAATAYRTRFLASFPNPSNSRYYQLASGLTWELARDWTLEAGFTYQHLKYDATPSAATGNTVYVTVTYRLPRQSMSR